MKKSLGLLAIFASCAFNAGCADFLRREPPSTTTVAVRIALNKSPQFGLEDKLTSAIRDEALREGRFPVVPEGKSDRIILVIIQRYSVQPAQYDSNLNPTAYKLRLGVDLQLLDGKGKQVIWQERDMDGVQSYASATLPGGLDEPGAQALIWDALSRDIVDRVARGLSVPPKPAPEAKPPAQPQTPQHGT